MSGGLNKGRATQTPVWLVRYKEKTVFITQPTSAMMLPTTVWAAVVSYAYFSSLFQILQYICMYILMFFIKGRYQLTKYYFILHKGPGIPKYSIIDNRINKGNPQIGK